MSLLAFIKVEIGDSGSFALVHVVVKALAGQFRRPLLPCDRAGALATAEVEGAPWGVADVILAISRSLVPSPLAVMPR